jgi:hypothetical protein
MVGICVIQGRNLVGGGNVLFQTKIQVPALRMSKTTATNMIEM